ncbi:hypothetical protein HMPREF9098_0890 [Kingella denitrificans ATCC 33394]|uniref:Uncharacterized protein n=1 Tax=Kingella denitrificans ATCC 33394 TaxID=888741 RepID=F0EYF6_9NEIS|nr:hypothetical protein HMPREF9098_0890 [Kingella denitrificans ATCC 33394]
MPKNIFRTRHNPVFQPQKQPAPCRAALNFGFAIIQFRKTTWN